MCGVVRWKILCNMNLWWVSESKQNIIIIMHRLNCIADTSRVVSDFSYIILSLCHTGYGQQQQNLDKYWWAFFVVSYFINFNDKLCGGDDFYRYMGILYCKVYKCFDIYLHPSRNHYLFSKLLRAFDWNLKRVSVCFFFSFHFIAWFISCSIYEMFRCSLIVIRN